MSAAFAYRFEETTVARKPVPRSICTRRNTLHIALGTCVVSAFNINATERKETSFDWHDNAEKYSGVPASINKPLYLDHITQLLGTGISQRLTVEKLISILDNNRGELLTRKTREAYRNIMSLFEGIDILDCHAIYSRYNRIIRSVIIMPGKLSLTLDLNIDSDMDYMAFTVDYDNSPVTSGIGPASEIADSTRQMIESLANSGI